jgi:hypothetical protein
MAYYLAVGNGASGETVSFSSTINTTTGNSFSVEWRSNYTSSGNATYAVTGSSVSNGIAITATEVRFYAFQGGTYTLAHNITDYTQLHTFRVDYDGTDLKLYVDNSLETTESNVGSSFFTASAISESGSRGSFDLYFLKITESGTLIHHFDPSATNGTGTTLEDTVGTNDGTLVSFDGTTNSWWVSYGGGATVIAPTAIASAESFGTPTIATGVVLIDPVAIPTQESVGTPTINSGVTIITPSAIPSQEFVGEPIVTPQGIVIQPVVIATEEAVGAPTLVTGVVIVIPDGIATEEFVGSPTIQLLLQDIFPNEIFTSEFVGRPRVIGGDVFLIPTAQRQSWNAVAAYLRTFSFKGSDNDVIVAWLRSEGIVDGTYNDLWNKYLLQNGFTALTLADNYAAWRQNLATALFENGVLTCSGTLSCEEIIPCGE